MAIGKQRGLSKSEYQQKTKIKRVPAFIEKILAALLLYIEIFDFCDIIGLQSDFEFIRQTRGKNMISLTMIDL